MNQIQDQFGRIHDYLRISLTERCNLRCTYCMPENGIELRDKSFFMTTEEILKIVNIFVSLGVKKIRLTGGEPLIRKDAGQLITELGKMVPELAITTNGVLAHQFLDEFNKVKVRSLNISLDSLQKDKFHTITRRDEFDKVKENIQLLLEEGFHVKVNVVLIRNLNDDEILDFVEWTRNSPVHVRFIEYMPFNGNNWVKSNCISSQDVIDKIQEHSKSKLIKLNDLRNDTAKAYKLEGYKGTFAVISSISNPFCESCNRLRLTADGKMKTCLFAEKETDLLTPLRAGKDIQKLILKAVWNKAFSRGGMNTIQKISDPNYHNKNRSMVAIGG